LPDIRTANKRHLLIDIITISICAVVCGASTYEQIVVFGKAKFKWLNTFLELPNGIPSHDTFGRVFSMIDPLEFQNSFMKWVEDVSQRLGNEIHLLRFYHNRNDLLQYKCNSYLYESMSFYLEGLTLWVTGPDAPAKGTRAPIC
jgi:hypothetical protein